MRSEFYRGVPLVSDPMQQNRAPLCLLRKSIGKGRKDDTQDAPAPLRR